MEGIYTEKEILGDALAAQKSSTGNFNTYANECVHEDVRQTMLHILKEEHDIQQDVFKMMHDKGYYPTPEAEQNKVNQVKQQYSQCVKC
ncbi:MAG: spore coat protein [Butyrivibrio sp.]